MKQILRYSFVALMAMVFGNVYADTEVTFTLNEPDAITALGIALPEAGQGTKVEEINKDGVKIVVTSGSTDSRIYQGSGGNAGKYDFRIYKNGGSLTFTAGTNVVKKIVFTGNNLGNLSGDGYATDTWTGSAASVTLTATGTATIYTITVTSGEASADDVQAPKFGVASGMYFEPQTVALTCETEGAKILYTISGEDPAYTDDSNYTGVFYDGTALTISKTATIKAMAVKDGKTSSIVTAIYTIVNVENPGTEASPFTVADALTLIDALSNGATTSETYYVKGVVVGTPEIQKKNDGTFYGNANFDIAAEAGGTTKLTCYRLKGLDNADIDSEDYIKEGDEVVVTGQLQKYVKDDVVTPEVKNGYIYSLNGTATGITAVKAAQQNGAIYNVAGQMVTSSYKGLVIKNGRKYIQK